MKRLLPIPLALWIVGLVSAGEDAERQAAIGTIQSIMQQHCVACHGAEGDAEGQVELTDRALQRLPTDAVLVRKLMNVLDTREMPPEGEPQPTAAQLDSMQAELKKLLPVAVAHSSDDVRTPIRRMNRFQYNNAVVDLFELDCIVFTLPERAMRIHNDYFDPSSGKMPDSVTVGNRPLGKSQMIEPRLSGVAAFPQDLRAEHGYDNRGDHLSLSPLLMEQFLKLGQSVTQSADFQPRRVGIWSRFFETPAKDADVHQEIEDRLRPFLTKAFRRPVDEGLLDRYARFASDKVGTGLDFTEAMKLVAAAAIASPRFLYLYDTEVQSSEATELSETVESNVEETGGFELASRLSFFLWGSLPDETLMSLAADGSLGKPDILALQADRMLRDKKLKRFCDSFPSQWLQLDRIVSSVPNREKFPKFYFSKYRTSMHMMLEPLLLFETVLIEDLPITQLIDADFTYRSAKLELAYGDLGNEPGPSKGGGVTKLTYRRKPVADRRSGGVITNAAVMTMTSGPERTQPITRGAWVAGVIFNDPPEPPPADVPPLSEEPPDGEEHLTLRGRLAAHRKRADCRGCHEQIDPLGFALENYDPVGVWREKYENGLRIEADGELFREHAFSDVAGFKDAVLADKDRFCRALAGHLLSFALARELGPADQMALDDITHHVAASGYRMQTLIRQIILSKPFRSKT